MKNIDWDVWLTAAIAIALVLLIVICCVYTCASMRAEKLCLERGWKDSTVTWDLTVYCIREENEYEIVRPLEEVTMEKDR